MRTASAVLPWTGGRARLPPPHTCKGQIFYPVHAKLPNGTDACLEQIYSPSRHWLKRHTRPASQDRPNPWEKITTTKNTTELPSYLVGRTPPSSRPRLFPDCHLLGRAVLTRAYRRTPKSQLGQALDHAWLANLPRPCKTGRRAVPIKEIARHREVCHTCVAVARPHCPVQICPLN